MTVLSPLLRVLLCLSLGLSGWADAYAAASMASGQPDRPMDADPPCHGDTDGHDQGVPEGAAPHDAGSCCTGACDCGCAHAPVGLTLATSPVGSSGHAAYRSAAGPGIATASLAHLIRPPIG